MSRLKDDMSRFILPRGVCLADARDMADLEREAKRRRITDIDTICLHQMACKNTSRGIQRWKGIECHWVVELEDERAYLMHDLDKRLWHGHGFNFRSVGIEVEGYYAGVDGDLSTFWKPKEAPDRQPMTLTCGMRAAIVAAIGATVDMVAAAGGEIKYIGAHRQSYGRKRSDPGSLIWQVAVLCQEALGLQEAPTLDKGRPIPEAWDPRNKGVEY